MNLHNTRLAAIATVLMLLLLVSPAQAAPNILFYGNSFTLNGGSGITIPQLVQRIAIASGKPVPTFTNPSTSGSSLLNHLQSNAGVITQGNPTWNFVVLQDFSTKPTNIAGMGNPAEFKSNAKSLSDLVRAQSPGAKTILFETWARSPLNVADLNNFYPGGATLFAKATQMQSELRQHYGEARALIGPSAYVAPVGDAFEDSGFNTGLYNGDLYHSSHRGALLASLVIYDTIYQTHSDPISYSAITSALNGLITPGNAGIGTTADWTNLKALADGVITLPEPATLGILTIGTIALLKRQRTRSFHATVA